MYEKVITKDGSVLEEKTIEEFKAGLRGQLIKPGDDNYNTARKIWNGMIDKYPALIAKCTGVADIIHSVNFARTHNIVVSVLGGGHNIAGKALCDGGLVIDLSMMKSVVVDPFTKTARVEPGITLGELDHETQAFGFATPVGINSTTGISGLTLGGGFGWLSGRFGLTVDNLLSANIVLQSGELIRASSTENSDIFWGIRGGGGNFGIVTSFEFKLHEVGPMVIAGLIIHSLDSAREVLKFYREFNKIAPEEFMCWFVLRKAPPFPFLAPEWHGKEILALAVLYTGKQENAEEGLRPLRSFGAPLADIIGPMPYTAWQKILDPVLVPGARNYWKTNNFRELSDGLIDSLLELVTSIPDPQTEIAFAHLGGAVSKVKKEETAYIHRDAEFVMNVHGRWEDPLIDDLCIAWARKVATTTAPFSTGGAYVNFLTEEEQDRVKAAYGSNYEKLVALKAKYDPNNFFSINQNIKPPMKMDKDAKAAMEEVE